MGFLNLVAANWAAYRSGVVRCVIGDHEVPAAVDAEGMVLWEVATTHGRTCSFDVQCGSSPVQVPVESPRPWLETGATEGQCGSTGLRLSFSMGEQSQGRTYVVPLKLSNHEGVIGGAMSIRCLDPGTWHDWVESLPKARRQAEMSIDEYGENESLRSSRLPISFTLRNTGEFGELLVEIAAKDPGFTVRPTSVHTAPGESGTIELNRTAGSDPATAKTQTTVRITCLQGRPAPSLSRFTEADTVTLPVHILPGTSRKATRRVIVMAAVAVLILASVIQRSRGPQPPPPGTNVTMLVDEANRALDEAERIRRNSDNGDYTTPEDVRDAQQALQAAAVRALSKSDKAIKLRSQFWEPYVTKAQALWALGRHDEARRAVEVGLSMCSDTGELPGLQQQMRREESGR